MLKLRELRENRQLSMLQLAQFIGVSDAAISNWENGVNEPKASYVIKLADYFQISTDELLGRENYATGSIEIVGEKLTEDEEQLLKCYRSLDKDGQRAFLDIAGNLSKVYRKNITVS